MKQNDDFEEFAKKDLEWREKHDWSTLQEEESEPSKPLSKSLLKWIFYIIITAAVFFALGIPLLKACSAFFKEFYRHF